MCLLTEWGNILSQCISILNHHIVYLTYILILFVSNTSIKLENTINGKAMISRACKNVTSLFSSLPILPCTLLTLCLPPWFVQIFS